MTREPRRGLLVGLFTSFRRCAVRGVALREREVPGKPGRWARLDLLGSHRIVRLVQSVERVREPVEFLLKRDHPGEIGGVARAPLVERTAKRGGVAPTV